MYDDEILKGFYLVRGRFFESLPQSTIQIRPCPLLMIINNTQYNFVTEREIRIYFPGRRHSCLKVNLYSTIRPTVDCPVYFRAWYRPPDCITLCIQITKIMRFYGRARVMGFSIRVLNDSRRVISINRKLYKLLFFSDIVWVLGRERDLAAASRAELYTLLYELNINPDRLILTKHEKCDNFF